MPQLGVQQLSLKLPSLGEINFLHFALCSKILRTSFIEAYRYIALKYDNIKISLQNLLVVASFTPSYMSDPLDKYYMDLLL